MTGSYFYLSKDDKGVYAEFEYFLCSQVCESIVKARRLIIGKQKLGLWFEKIILIYLREEKVHKKNDKNEQIQLPEKPKCRARILKRRPQQKQKNKSSINPKKDPEMDGSSNSNLWRYK